MALALTFQTLSATSLFIFTLLCFLIVSLYHFLGPKYDPQEPPVIPQTIPYIGHIIGLLRYGHGYLEDLYKKHNLPIYTLQTFTKRTYVINSPDLVLAVQKYTKMLTFDPFVVAMIPRIVNLAQRDLDIVKLNNDGSKGDWGFMHDTHRVMYSTLAPGPDLNQMLGIMLHKIFDSLNAVRIKQQNGGDVEVEMYHWLRKAFTMISTEAVYGPENPFTHEPGMEDAFWDYEAGMTTLLLGVWPSYTASKACMGRDKIASAMKSYFLRNGHDHERASRLVKARYEVGKMHKLSLEAISMMELGNIIGFLINATTTTFWMLWQIYSSPDLLSSLRAEQVNAWTVMPSASNSSGRKMISLDVSKLKSHCPLLFSTYQEVLRVRTHHATARWVLADTVVADRYLFKRDSVIQMPAHVIHSNSSLWGADVDDFNPRRFIKQATQAKSKDSTSHNVKPGSFRAFGGGATLCPGRHFATMEIMSAVAMVIMRFDITPIGTAAWIEPQPAGGRVASSISPPAKDIKVKISAKEGSEDVVFLYGGIGEGDTTRFDVV